MKKKNIYEEEHLQYEEEHLWSRTFMKKNICEVEHLWRRTFMKKNIYEEEHLCLIYVPRAATVRCEEKGHL